MMFFKSSPEQTACAGRLSSTLSQQQVEQTLSYAALNEIAGGGFDLLGKHRHILYRAIKMAEADQGCIFASVRGVGIKRLSRSRTPDVGVNFRRRVRRGAKRASARILHVVTKRGNDMSETDRRRSIAEAAGLGAIATVAGAKFAHHMDRTLPRNMDIASPIPRFDVLKLFQKDTAS